jgi:hypothetical protein
MPFEVGFQSGPGGINLGGIVQSGLEGLIGVGTSFLGQVLTAGGQEPSIREGMDRGELTIGTSQGMNGGGACCNGQKAKGPEFIVRLPSESVSPNPCFPRPSQRTVRTDNGCKVTVLTWAPERRAPRMNVANGRALSRSLRRVSGFARAAKRARGSINKAARAIK